MANMPQIEKVVNNYLFLYVNLKNRFKVYAGIVLQFFRRKALSVAMQHVVSENTGVPFPRIVWSHTFSYSKVGFITKFISGLEPKISNRIFKVHASPSFTVFRFSCSL